MARRAAVRQSASASAASSSARAYTLRRSSRPPGNSIGGSGSRSDRDEQLDHRVLVIGPRAGVAHHHLVQLGAVGAGFEGSERRTEWQFDVVAGAEVDVSTPDRTAQHEQGVRAVVAVVAHDHARVVSSEQGEVHRIDVEGDPLLSDMGLGAVGVSLTSDLDVGDLVVVIGPVGEDRTEAVDTRGVHDDVLGRRGAAGSRAGTLDSP